MCTPSTAASSPRNHDGRLRGGACAQPLPGIAVPGLLWPQKPSSCTVIALSASAAACRARSSRSAPLRHSHPFLRPVSQRATCSSSPCSRARTALRSAAGDRSPSIHPRDSGSSRVPPASTSPSPIGTAMAALSTAAVPDNPGRCAASNPPAAPVNNARNVGPPRVPSGSRGGRPRHAIRHQPRPGHESPARLPPAALPGCTTRTSATGDGRPAGSGR